MTITLGDDSVVVRGAELDDTMASDAIAGHVISVEADGCEPAEVREREGPQCLTVCSPVEIPHQNPHKSDKTEDSIEVKPEHLCIVQAVVLPDTSHGLVTPCL